MSKTDFRRKAARDLRAHAELAKTEQALGACFRAFARCLAPECVEMMSGMLAKSVRRLWLDSPPNPAAVHLQDWHWG